MTTLGILLIAALGLVALAALLALFFERRAGVSTAAAAEAERDLANEQVGEERDHIARLHERVRHLEESARADREALDEERGRTAKLTNARQGRARVGARDARAAHAPAARPLGAGSTTPTTCASSS